MPGLGDDRTVKAAGEGRATSRSSLTVLKAQRFTFCRASMVRTEPGRFALTPTCEVSLLFPLGAPWRPGQHEDRPARPLASQHGCFDIIPPGAIAVWQEDEAALWMSLWLTEALLESVAGKMATPRRSLSPEPLAAQRDGRILGAAMLLRAELEADCPDPLFADSLATAISARLLERFGAEPSATAAARLTPSQLKRIVDFVDAHLAEDLGLGRLASVVGLSESHFRLLFRQTVGRPVHQYVVDMRLQRARGLLTEGKLPIAQVALEAGFCHQSHLARAMRRKWRVTPSAFQRQERIDRASPGPEAIQAT